MEDAKKSRASQIVLWLFVLTFALAVGASFYRYLYKKNYEYLVEAACDPTVQNCFVRDCTNPDDCPPNGLSVYKEYHVRASDFAKCSDDSCEAQCTTGAIACTSIACDSEAGDTCSSQ